MIYYRQQRAAQISRALPISRSHKSQSLRRLMGMRKELCRIDFHHRAEPVTSFAGSVGRVERERTRLERWHADTTNDAGHLLRIEHLLAVDDGDKHRPAAEFQSNTDRLRQAFIYARLNQEAIDYRFDGVIAALVELDLFVERKQLAVNSGAKKPVVRQFFQLFFEFAFAAADDRRHDHYALVLRQRQHVQHDLFDALTRNRRVADGAVRLANRRE